MRPITFAHRGARSEQPENTLAAFQRALELGAGGLETDAWLSSDGEVVLVHDGVFRRGFRRIHVDRMPAERLTAHGVPRLADVYAQLGTDFELSIDVKNQAAAAPILATADAASPDARARLWLCAPSIRFLRKLRSVVGSAHLVHSRSRQHLPEPLERHAADLADAGIAAMNLHHREWTAGVVALFHRFDVRAFAWDAQEVRHIRAVLEMGIDGIYCDHVDRMVATVGEFSREER